MNTRLSACVTTIQSDIKHILQFDSTILATGVSKMALGNCSQAPDSGKMCGSVLERDCQLSEAGMWWDGIKNSVNVSDFVST